LNENAALAKIRSNLLLVIVRVYVEKSPGAGTRSVRVGLPSLSTPQSVASSMGSTGTSGIVSPPVMVTAVTEPATETGLTKWTRRVFSSGDAISTKSIPFSVVEATSAARRSLSAVMSDHRYGHGLAGLRFEQNVTYLDEQLRCVLACCDIHVDH